MNESKIKALLPEGVEAIIVKKDDYDRLYGDMTLENIELKQEIERLNNIINDIDTYIHLWKLDDIEEKTMLILNDILLIKNGLGNEVVRLNGSDKE